MPRKPWKKIVIQCARTAEELKGNDIAVMDLRRRSLIADYFVIVSSENPVFYKAYIEKLRDIRKTYNLTLMRVDGADRLHWTIVDVGNILIHVFDPMARLYYEIEQLWGDAPRVKWQQQD